LVVLVKFFKIEEVCDQRFLTQHIKGICDIDFDVYQFFMNVKFCMYDLYNKTFQLIVDFEIIFSNKKLLNDVIVEVTCSTVILFLFI